MIKENQEPSPRLGKLVFSRLDTWLELSLLFCKNVFPFYVTWELSSRVKVTAGVRSQVVAPVLPAARSVPPRGCTVRQCFPSGVRPCRGSGR